MSGIDPNKMAAYRELLKRRDTLSPDKQQLLGELGRRLAMQAGGDPTGKGVDEVSYPAKNALKAVADFTTGIDKAGGSFIQSGGDWVQSLMNNSRQNYGLPTKPIPPPRMTPTGRDVFAPDNTAQSVGNVVGQIGLGIGGGMAGGPTLAGGVAAGGLTGALQNPDAPAGPATLGMVAPMIPAAIRALPSRSRAGANLEKIKKAVGSQQINQKPISDIVKEARSLEEAGSNLPKVVRKAGKAVDAGDLNYEKAFKMGTRAGRLSSSERLKGDPQMGAQVAQLSAALRTGTRDLAAKGGMGELYDAAIKEYRQAARLSSAASAAAKIAAKYLLPAAGGVAAWEAMKKLSGK